MQGDNKMKERKSPARGDFTPSKQSAGRSLLGAHFGALPRTPQEKLFVKKFLLTLQKLFRYCFFN